MYFINIKWIKKKYYNKTCLSDSVRHKLLIIKKSSSLKYANESPSNILFGIQFFFFFNYSHVLVLYI